MNKNTLKEKLKNGQPCLGTFIRMQGSMTIEILGEAGWDFVVIDMEHGIHSVSDLLGMKRAAAAAGISTVVRIPSPTEIDVMRALDAGGEGVQVPQLRTIEQIKTVCAAARFAPLGNRGSCAYTSSARYTFTPYAEHIETSNEQVLVVIHIENKESAEMIDEILEVPGIDVVFCGPWDLSQSFGIPGQTQHPIVKDTIKKVVSKCKAKGVSSGMFINKIEHMTEWLEAGVTYFTYGVDVGLFAEISRSIRGEISANIEQWSK